MNKLQNPVDIIIPIYNAYEDLQICLASLYKYTDLAVNRLVLIDDNSPDERILPFLKQQERENVIVIHNTENRGFSANINIGMSQSDTNDVILLNSDTILTKGWVNKMVHCAYSDSSIGTVTPLSNNATLCSVPNMFEENWLPEGITVDEAADIIEKSSMHKYPHITVAHGFCMLVKREVIKLVGGFDSETFGRGYGEENDFCNRVEQFGYHHVMCDDTYIYHTGTKSFISKEKEELIRSHTEILYSRYEEQMHAHDIYVRDNPNVTIGENVNLHLMLEMNKDKKNILYLIQADFRDDAKDHVGGTQLHVKHLVAKLKNKANIFVAAMNGFNLNVTAYMGDKESCMQFSVEKNTLFYEFNNKSLENIWRNIITSFNIDLIHVHHTITTSFDIFYVAKEYGVPVVATLHDYYYVCPSVKLIDSNGKTCFCDEIKSDSCIECLYEQCRITKQINYLPMWQKKCLEVLECCKQLYVPDESVKDIFLHYYPSIKNQIRIIPHGYEMSESAKEYLEKVTDRGEYDGELRIAFIGGINEAKGGLIINNLIKLNIPHVKWYIMGDIGEKALKDLEHDNLIKTGPYDSEDLPRLLVENKIDLIGILSIWPETYSYTLTEAILSRIPVITTDIGALGRRTKEYDYGWTIPIENAAEEFTHIIHELLSNNQILLDKKHKLINAAVDSLEGMANKYYDLYESLFTDRCYESNINFEFIYEGLDFRGRDSMISTEEARLLQKRLDAHVLGYNNALKEIASLKGSKTYMIGQKIRGILTRK